MRSLLLVLVILLGAPSAHADSASPPAPRVTITAVGDMLFGRYVRSRAAYRLVPRVPEPFSDVAPILQRADIAFGNLENPVMKEPATFRVHKTLTFRGELSSLTTLAEAGFDVLSLANNHTLNLGPKGAPTSRRNIEAAGMVAVGAGATEQEAFAPVVVERNGVRIAFLAATIWTNGRKAVYKDGAVAYLTESSTKRVMVPLVTKAREELNVDFVVVSLHWGWEYTLHPKSHQREAARAMIDAGADLILGHHPHWVQDIEVYQGKPIIYSLGNFMFDNSRLPQRRTVIFEATLVGRGDARRVVTPKVYPVLIDKQTKAPRLARGADYTSWAKVLRTLAPDVAIAEEPAAASSP